MVAALGEPCHPLPGDGLRVVRIDCGHMVYWEAFDGTAGAVDDFFRSAE